MASLHFFRLPPAQFAVLQQAQAHENMFCAIYNRNLLQICSSFRFYRWLLHHHFLRLRLGNPSPRFLPTRDAGEGTVGGGESQIEKFINKFTKIVNLFKKVVFLQRN